MVRVDTSARCVSVPSDSSYRDYGRLILFPAAWAGSLINGPVADHLGRKLSINMAVVIFVIGSAIQCGAVNIPMLFTGKCMLHI
jgi:hypothetical protein